MKGVPHRGYTIQTLFNKYRDESLLSKLENYALWTIPSVFPRNGEDNYYDFQNRQIEYDCQSIGAGLVNMLATKLASTLFPANTSFFRMQLSDDAKAVLEEKQIQDVIAYENKACERLFLKATYAQLIQAMRLLIITGECLVHRYMGTLRVFSLRDYACKRNNVGEVLDIITREHKFWSELDPSVQALIGRKPEHEKLKLYTRVKRVVKNGFVSWKMTQEIEGCDIGTDVTYRDKLCPFIPVVWSYSNGDNYGRGHVEDYAADIYKLSRLSEALADYQFESMRILYLHDPSKFFDAKHAEMAATGEYVTGAADAVVPLEAGAAQKMQQVMLSLSEVEQRLNKAFMNTSNQRDAERVTAYEVRLAAEEAEQVLGGVYSQLSQSLHLPLAYLLLDEADNTIIEAFDLNHIKLEILTGLQALSRSTSNQSLVMAVSDLTAILPVFTQGGLGKEWNINKIAEGVFSSYGLTVADMKYTEKELLAIQQAEQQAQATQAMQAQAMGGAGISGQDQLAAVQASQQSKTLI